MTEEINITICVKATR